MKWVCECGAELDLSPPEYEKGFWVGHTVCPKCGQTWVLRLTKGVRMEVKE